LVILASHDALSSEHLGAEASTCFNLEYVCLEAFIYDLFDTHTSPDPSAFLCGRCFTILSMKILRDDGLFRRAVIMEVLLLYRFSYRVSSNDVLVFTECCDFNIIA